MVVSDLVQTLRAEGLQNASRTRIRHGIAVEHIPRPSMNGSGQFEFQDHDIEAVRQYLRNVPKPGRKPEPAPAAD